jgi:glyoxylase-like metal-dependent hydrolase (beta-lactamase superfamily II)/ferredoxin
VARLAARLPQNAPGDFFVDDTCIDCGTCRIVAPGVFRRSDAVGMTIVQRQPVDAAEAKRAAMALVACPTSSIGALDKTGVRAASAAFPDPIEQGGSVYYCGFASEHSFGASSYLIVRPEGNVLVDSPRAAKPLMDAIEALGGVRTMLLSHKDDVADHTKYAARFGCSRVMHAADVGSGTRDVEQKIEGDGPVPLAPDLTVIPLAGHTRGSIGLLYGGRFLFTGDHLWWDEDELALGASRSVCWYSWREQTRSMQKLLAFEFDWVLPGHGMPHHAKSPTDMREKLASLVGRMKRGG